MNAEAGVAEGRFIHKGEEDTLTISNGTWEGEIEDEREKLITCMVRMG